MLGRRTPGDPASPQNDSDDADDTAQAAVPAARTDKPVNPATLKKGRETPKRSVAERRRVPVVAPTNRRDAARLSRQQRAVKRNDSRKALVAGDERGLPARDRGALRRYVRDWADAKRTLAEFLLPGIVILYFPTLFLHGNTRTDFSVALSVVVFVILVELFTMVFFLRRAVAREFPEGGPGRKGAIAYGAMRLASVRMFRLPKPAVKRGQQPRPINTH